MRRRAHRRAHHAAVALDDREVRRLAVHQRRHPQPRAEPEDQVVLGLPRAEELARVGEEAVGALVPRELHAAR